MRPVDLYYTIIGWYLWRRTKHRIMKTVSKTFKDRRKVRQMLDDKDRIRRRVYVISRIWESNGMALEENRAFMD